MIAVEESLLVAVHRIIGRIAVEDDFVRRSLALLQERSIGNCVMAIGLWLILWWRVGSILLRCPGWERNDRP
jgi:hypothetical protein